MTRHFTLISAAVTLFVLGGCSDDDDKEEENEKGTCLATAPHHELWLFDG